MFYVEWISAGIFLALCVGAYLGYKYGQKVYQKAEAIGVEIKKV